MHEAFQVHTLTAEGKAHAVTIAEEFDHLVSRLDTIIPEGRLRSIVITKLEEACFFAKKAMAQNYAERT